MYESEAFLKITVWSEGHSSILDSTVSFCPKDKRNSQFSGSVNIGLSSSPILAEAKDSKDSTDEREEAE